MARRLEGRTCIVTGAAMGIGRAVADRLAEEGANVVLGDIEKSLAAQASADIERSGGSAVSHWVDVSERASVSELIAYAAGPFRVAQRDVQQRWRGPGGTHPGHHAGTVGTPHADQRARRSHRHPGSS